MPKKRSGGTKKPRREREEAPRDYIEPHLVEGWSAVRATVAAEEKKRMARHFVQHDLFVQENETPGDGREVSAAKVTVNPGTTPNEIVRQALEWVKTEVDNNPAYAGAPHITWYTPGSLVPATLLDFRVTHPHLRNCCGLHLYPGMVDSNLDMVRGTEAVNYARQLEKCFTYALLSGYAFDMSKGTVFFFFDDEVELQRAMALSEAEHKFLFLEPEKFKREGSKAYSIRELLQTSTAVTIYTVSSQKDATVEKQFRNLAESLLDTGTEGTPDRRRLRLVIVGKDKPVNLPITGGLKPEQEDGANALQQRSW